MNRRTMTMSWKRPFVHGLMLIGVSLLSGCALWEMMQTQNSADAPPADPAAAPADPAAPQATTSPFTAITAPPLQALATAPVRESYGCLTANYFADIVWQQDQPQLSIGRRPAEVSLQGAVAKVTGNADGSFTYAVNREALYYTRVYPDRTCLIQVVDPASGRPTLEESGRLGGLVLSQAK